MIGHKPQPAEALDIVQPVEQIGQPHLAAGARIVVTIDGLAQEGDGQAAVGDQAAGLGLDPGGRPALLRPADQRHDAIRAALVAAQRDPQHGLLGHGPQAGRPRRVVRGLSQFSSDENGTVPFGGTNLRKAPGKHWRDASASHGDDRSAAGRHLIQQFPQPAQLARPHDQVHVACPVKDLPLVLLRHAAQDADDRLGPPLFERPQAAQGTIHLVFGVLADAARIQQDRVGLPRTIDQLVAGLQQVGRHQLAIQYVHLAAERLDVEAFGHLGYEL